MKKVTLICLTSLAMSAALSAEAAEPTTVLYENFSNLTDAPGSLPEGWTRQCSSDEMATLCDGIFVWNCGFDRDNFGSPVDGDNYAYIAHAHFEDENKVGHDLDQDEWLITPAVQLGSESHISFYVSYVPLFLFNCSNEYLDFTSVPFTFREKVPATTLKLMVRAEGDEEWAEALDVFDDWADYELEDMLTKYAGRQFYDYDLDMAAYDGRKVNFAFRFVGYLGNAMAVDAVKVTTDASASIKEVSSAAETKMTLHGTILSVAGATGAADCAVYAVDGREVGSWALDADGSAEIDLSGLNSGVYVAKAGDAALKIAF